jgi:hypothetical protein
MRRSRPWETLALTDIHLNQTRNLRPRQRSRLKSIRNLHQRQYSRPNRVHNLRQRSSRNQALNLRRYRRSNPARWSGESLFRWL